MALGQHMHWSVPNCDRSTDELLQMVNWVKLDRQRLVDKSIIMYKIGNRRVWFQTILVRTLSSVQIP